MTEEKDPVIDWKALQETPEYEVARICQIKTSNLDDALRKHASIYAYASAAQAKARADLAEAEWAYEKAKANAFSALREAGAAIGEAKETAELEEAVMAAKEEVLRRDRNSRILWSLVQGLEHRKDMIVQLSARERAELNNSY